MEDKHFFTCPHCGKPIYVSQQPPAGEPAPEEAEETQPASSPDEIPTTAVEVAEIPLKDVILEPEPIEEVEPIEELEPEPIEELEEISPEELEEYVPRPRAARPGRRPRPDAAERPARPGRRPPRGPAPRRPVRGRKPAEGGAYDLVLDPIEDEGLEDVAIDLIMDIAGVSEKQALRMIQAPRIVVLRGVTREEAEDALAQFEEEGLTGSVKRRRIIR